MTDPIMDAFLEFNPNPSEWYKYRCRSCSHSDWIEDIVWMRFRMRNPRDSLPSSARNAAAASDVTPRNR